LSDREAEDITIDGLVADLECVVDDAGLDRFALLGMSQGGAVSIVYAARHPERVSHLVLCGAFARGPFRRSPSGHQVEATEAMIKLVEFGWGQSNPAFLQMFTSQFFPQATLAQAHSFNEIQRHAASPRVAARLIRAFSGLDASAELAQVRAPTLVFHSRGDNRVPFDEGRFVATSIAGARFEPLDSNSHVPLPGEPAFERLLDAMAAFVMPGQTDTPFAGLTRREREVLERIARGLDNAQIAAQLGLAEKTVRNHITAIFDKIAVENRSQAIVAARIAGLGSA
jgi:pimeloyl-ACP methyl ester carboxylesterase/DNA-binding CsgD family transcriptional regulator